MNRYQWSSARTGGRSAVTCLAAMTVAGALAVAAFAGCADPEGGNAEGESASSPQDSGEMAGMDMGESAGTGAIQLTTDAISTFGITFGIAEVRPISKTIRAVGLVEFDEARMAYLSPKFGGWVDALHADFTGQPVRRGQPLLDVYSPELVSAQEELLLASRMATQVAESRVPAVVSGASDLFESARRRLSYWDISEEQIERILEEGEVRRTMTLYAPLSGIVMEKNAVEGEAFQAGTNLYMIADISRVWVNVEVFEADVGLVSEGMPVTVLIAALPGRTFAGRIEFVYPTLADRTRSLRARVSMPNPGGILKPGMYATVTASADLGETLSLPTTAVLRTGERAVAFVDMGAGNLMPHELTLGLQGEGYVQVLDGVTSGQRIVTSAQFLLDSESNLAEVMRAMMAQMNLTDMADMDMSDMDMGGTDAMGPDSGGAMEGMDMGDGRRELPAPDTTGGH